LQDPPAFTDFVVGLYSHEESGGANPRWPGSSLVVRAVTTPILCPLPEALQLARAALRLDSQLDTKIVRHLGTPARNWPESASDDDILHVLEVIDAISDCQRLILFLMKWVKAPNPRVKSKAVKLIARACRNPSWAKVILSDPDHRTRANLIEGLGLQTGAQIKAVLIEGTADSDPRVALNALLALSRNGGVRSYQTICKLAHDRRPEFRRAAEWALRQMDAGVTMEQEDTGANPSTSVPHRTA